MNLQQKLKSNVMRIIDPCKECHGLGEIHTQSWSGHGDSTPEHAEGDCSTCLGKGYVEELDYCNACLTEYPKPLTLQQILLALVMAGNNPPKEGVERPYYDIDFSNLGINVYNYEETFILNIPLTLEPSQYPEELTRQLIELTA